MPVAIARVTPTDFDAWWQAHVSALSRFGRALGAVHETIYRDHDDLRTVVIVQIIEDVDRAKAVLASPEFQRIIAEAPIEGPPTFWFLDTGRVLDIAALWEDAKG